MTHAEAGLRDLVLSISLFFQAPGGTEQSAALEVFKSARLLVAAPPR